MSFRIEETADGKFHAVFHNESFHLDTVYKFDTREDAQYFIDVNTQEREARLSEIVTISDYFKA